MSNLSTLPKGDSAWLLRKAIERIIQQVSVLETNIGASTSGNSANTQIIFNDNGTLRGDAGLVYNKTTDTLTAGSAVITGAATITGDLTVRTNKLVVTSTGAGFGTATPGTSLEVWKDLIRVNSDVASGVYGTQFWRSGVERGRYGFDFSASLLELQADGDIRFLTGGETERYRIDSTGISTWAVAGTTAMTLNSTGLGIGVAPQAKLHATTLNPTDGVIELLQNLSTSGQTGAKTKYEVANVGASGIGTPNGTTNALAFFVGGITSAEERMRIDSSGNVGIGITPSAWATATTVWRALDLQYSCGIASSGAGSGEIDFLWNAYYDQTDQRWEFKYTGDRASRYAIGGSGVHTWYNTASTGTANAAITWNPAMTLDASGNLLVGKTSAGFGTVGNEMKAVGEIFSTQASNSDAATTYHAYSTTAAVYRFYVGLGGTVFATNTVISAISDARLKENVQDIDVGLAAILSLKPRKFDWKSGKGKDIKGDRGFIAQEFEAVFPNLVDDWKDPAPEGEAPYKSVRQDLIPVLVKAIQELTARVQTLEAR